MSYSPDDRIMISAHEGGKLRIWNAQSYELEQLLEEPGLGIYDTAISADGKLLAYASSDDAIIVRDLETRKKRVRLSGDTPYIPFIHLLLREQKLYAATELGSRVRFDLIMFYIDYCDLMERVWREVFWIWEEGRARFREIPSDHECFKRG